MNGPWVLHQTVTCPSSPQRATQARLIDNFPPEISREIVRRFSPSDRRIVEADVTGTAVTLHMEDGSLVTVQPPDPRAVELLAIRGNLQNYFMAEEGFSLIDKLNYLDGIRIYFRNGDIAHPRPSGNAPQLRIYAVSDSQARADEIVEIAVREPDGILRQLERALT